MSYIPQAVFFGVSLGVLGLNYWIGSLRIKLWMRDFCYTMALWPVSHVLVMVAHMIRFVV